MSGIVPGLLIFVALIAGAANISKAIEDQTKAINLAGLACLKVEPLRAL